jgi:predicted lipoprotein with Yx(FWY)xxD motif
MAPKPLIEISTDSVKQREVSMNNWKMVLLAAAITQCVSGAAAMAQGAMPAGTADTAKGKTLVDAKGMSLYSFDKDTAGKSACNGPCAANWPFFKATDAAPPANWSVVTRDDGSKQWAYKDHPLYTFAKDAAPGDIKGDGVFNNAWHVAQP